MEPNTPYFFVEIGKIDLKKLDFEKKYVVKYILEGSPHTMFGFNLTDKNEFDYILLSSSEMIEMGLEVPGEKNLLENYTIFLAKNRAEFYSTSGFAIINNKRSEGLSPIELIEKYNSKTK